MSESESQDANRNVAEELVAYLDGELDGDTSKLLERRLAESAEYRRELRRLQRAWDMLEELPRAEVSDTFTQTTIEMVALSAHGELQDLQGCGRRRLRRSWAVAGVGLAVAAVAGYLAVAAHVGRPNTELVRDLPVVEDLDLYEIADSVQFLRQLHASHLFDEEMADAP